MVMGSYCHVERCFQLYSREWYKYNIKNTICRRVSNSQFASVEGLQHVMEKTQETAVEYSIKT